MSRRSSRTPTPTSAPITPQNPAKTPTSSSCQSKCCCKRFWNNFTHNTKLLEYILYVSLTIAVISLIAILGFALRKNPALSTAQLPINGTDPNQTDDLNGTAQVLDDQDNSTQPVNATDINETELDTPKACNCDVFIYPLCIIFILNVLIAIGSKMCLVLNQ